MRACRVMDLKLKGPDGKQSRCDRLFERQSPGISRVPGIVEIESARGFRHFQRLIVGEVRAIMPRGGSASTGPEPGQRFVDLLRVRGKVGKHCPGSKDGYTVRRLEMSSKVVIGSLAYLDHVEYRRCTGRQSREPETVRAMRRKALRPLVLAYELPPAAKVAQPPTPPQIAR